MTDELDRMQRWMLEVVSCPEGTEAGIRSDAARSWIDTCCSGRNRPARD